MNSRFFLLEIVLASSIMFSLSSIGFRAEPSYDQGSVGALQPVWNVTRGGPRADEGWGVAVDDEGNVYFAGFDRISRVTADVFLCKFTQEGVELWHTYWGGAFDDEAFIVTVQDDFVYVGGRTFKSFLLTSADMFVLKFRASDGSLVWSQIWDGGNGYDEADGLVVDGNSLYLAGWTTGASTQMDITVLRYDVDGTFVWSRSWGTAGVDEANGQIAVDENYIYVVGHYNALPLGFGGDAVMVAFDKIDGDYAWHTTWGGGGLDDAFGMTMGSGFIYSVGITNSFGGDLIFLLKYDKQGLLVWNVTWGGEGSELARSVGLNQEGTAIYIAGNTMSFGAGNFDVVLLGYDQDGNLLLSKTWGGRMLDQSHGMAIDNSFVYIAGETKSFGGGNEDAFLLKVNTIGEISDAIPPVAKAGPDQEVKAGDEVVFDASESSDNIGVVSYFWDFGDGNTGTGKTTTHIYTNPGTYTVKLTVSDAAQNSATATTTITVEAPFPLWIVGVLIAVGITAIVTVCLRKTRKRSSNQRIIKST